MAIDEATVRLPEGWACHGLARDHCGRIGEKESRPLQLGGSWHYRSLFAVGSVWSGFES